jgi:hypothetical protein
MLDFLFCAHVDETWRIRPRRWPRRGVDTGYWCPDCGRFYRADLRLPLRRAVPDSRIGWLGVAAAVTFLLTVAWLVRP